MILGRVECRNALPRWSPCCTDVFLDKLWQYRTVQDTYCSNNNRKVGLGWISYLRMGSFYTNFSIISADEFLISCKSHPALLVARFHILIVVSPVLYVCTVLELERNNFCRGGRFLSKPIPAAEVNLSSILVCARTSYTRPDLRPPTTASASSLPPTPVRLLPQYENATTAV